MHGIPRTPTNEQLAHETIPADSISVLISCRPTIMPNDEGGSTNLFVRFKHHVDAAVGSGLQSIFGLPSFVTQNFDARAVREPFESSRPSVMTASPPYRGKHSSMGSYIAGAGIPSASSPSNAAAAAAAANDDDDDAVHPPSTRRSHYHFEPAVLEATIDYLSDGSLEDHRLAWDLFLRHSSYSPAVLQSTLGQGPPRPRDLPDDVDASYLTWADAFEDLLKVSSALPLPDIVVRAREATIEAGLSAHAGFLPGATHSVASSLRRLRTAGSMNHVYLPVDDHKRGYRSPRTMEEWVEKRAAESRARKVKRPRLTHLGAVVPELGFPTSSTPRAPETRSGDWKGEEQVRRPLDDLKALAGFIQGAVGLLDDLSVRTEDQSRREKRVDTISPVVPAASEAKTEEDLYQSWQASTGNQQEGKAENSGWRIQSSWSTESTSTTTEGGKTTTKTTKRDPSGTMAKTVAEFVDEEGRRHMETVVQKTDPEGHVTTQRHHVVQAAGQWKEIEESRTGSEKQSIKDDESKKDGRKGWFW